MSVLARRARLLDATYKAFGEPALWTPAGAEAATPTVVRRVSGDEVVSADRLVLIVGSVVLRLRCDGPVVPAQGDGVVILGENGQTVLSLVVVGDPWREALAMEWLVQAAPTAP